MYFHLKPGGLLVFFPFLLSETPFIKYIIFQVFLHPICQKEFLQFFSLFLFLLLTNLFLSDNIYLACDTQVKHMREWLSWWSTTLPRSGPRVRVPSRALIILRNIGMNQCFFFVFPSLISKLITVHYAHSYQNLKLSSKYFLHFCADTLQSIVCGFFIFS